MPQDGSHEALIAGALAAARQAGQSPALPALVNLMFAGGVPEDLAPFSAAQLCAIAKGRLDFIQARKPGRPKIAIASPEEPPATVIDILNDDMPFLVDSTLAIFAERGIDIRLFLHPVLTVNRDAQGHLVTLHPGAQAEGARESLMHVHAARLDAEAIEGLRHDLEAALADARLAVLDWRSMQQRVRQAIAAYQSAPPPVPIDDLTESIAFLQWLLDNHFTLLGMREYSFEGGAKTGELRRVAGSALGILRNSQLEVLERGGEDQAMTPEIRDFLMQPHPLIITKSDARSTVHRRAAMDYVGVKLFAEEGELAGELRIVGLFTSSAYTQSPNDIPLLRRKLQRVVAASGFSPSGHSGKALISVLENFPRDELFQIDAETLSATAQGILRIEERPRTRVFARRDKFDRFVSAFAFIPRDRFNSDTRYKVGELIARAFEGDVTDFAPSFGEGSLVRVHFLMARRPGTDPRPDMEALEREVAETVRSWDDRLEAAIGDPARARLWRGAFPAGYRETAAPVLALKDMAELDALSAGDTISVEFSQRADGPPGHCRLRLYHQGGAIPLSRRLPILEDMGFRAISETTHDLAPSADGQRARAVIHDILLETADGDAAGLAARRAGLEAAFMAVWTGAAENDALNALALKAGLGWREAALLRALGRYLKQAAATFSNDYMAQTLVKHPEIAGGLIALFAARLDPASASDAAAAQALSAIETLLAEVPSLDEDRIVRRFLNLIGAISRSNFYQAGPPATISFKIDSRAIEGLPEPKPFAEIFVYAPDVEGVHLRGGRIARGGLRWSDRPEDFRTEVLGLQKAQSVKNAVIVPVGAKGGFVPKKLPLAREAMQAEGVRTYKLFVSSLLELTDNIAPQGVEPPPATLRRDGDDPYLVVAADKGTATFSDLANAMSREHGFWLDDAFASGGSAGYDHKKMAITARGAWEAVKRHFRELGTDIQAEAFTVVGVGDMSGDVFGNAMLLSRQIRLLVAFDHRDIFIDPDPDPKTSFEERQRLFGLARSSWQDYRKELISKGGGIYSRSLKSIPLSPEIQALTGLAATAATPPALIKALLKLATDLLWFGGIGTYVKATSESHADVGDRANDALRLDASELNARVVGEGANLGLTQKARIEFALAGGRLNTDAVDNSAGVNSSDIEVNIKIALGAAEAASRLTREARNALLASMTEDVAGLVLRNNYLQTLCLSLAQAGGTEENGYAMQLMAALEQRGLLDRKLEALPSDAAVIERDQRAQGLTRPELAVLMAYAKLALKHDLLDSDVPDDPYLSRQLKRYFPAAMRQAYGEEIEGHRLRREIIATMLANSMINRGGPSFASRLMEETGRSAGDVAAGFAVARDSFDFTDLNGLIDRLDGMIAGPQQNRLYLALLRFQRWAALWFLRHESLAEGLESLVARYKAGLMEVESLLAEVLPESARAAMADERQLLDAAGVPAQAAMRLAGHAYLQRGLDIVKIAGDTGLPLATVARALFASGEALGIERLAGAAGGLSAKDFVERLAINRLIAQVFGTHRAIVSAIVKAGGDWAGWRAAKGREVERALTALEALAAAKPFDLARLAVAQGTLADLARP